MQVDLAMPANLTDPSSKTTYFQAATMLSKAAASGTDVNQIQPIPFFENMFPAWASVTQSQLSSQSTALNCAPGSYPSNPTATQNIYEIWNCFPHNETFSLFEYWICPASITGLSPTLPNSKNGPYSFFHDQFASLYAWRNIGTSDYNALQVTYNARWGANLQGQFNYTFSKSFDEASAAERIGPYEGTGGTGNDLNGGGIVINSWDPLSLRGLSDFNAFHQINANLVYRLPFGKGQNARKRRGASAQRIDWRLARLRHIPLDQRLPDHHRQRFHLGHQLEHRRRCRAERAGSRGIQPQECHRQWRGHRPRHLQRSGGGARPLSAPSGPANQASATTSSATACSTSIPG